MLVHAFNARCSRGESHDNIQRNSHFTSKSKIRRRHLEFNVLLNGLLALVFFLQNVGVYLGCHGKNVKSAIYVQTALQVGYWVWEGLSRGAATRSRLRLSWRHFPAKNWVGRLELENVHTHPADALPRFELVSLPVLRSPPSAWIVLLGTGGLLREWLRISITTSSSNSEGFGSADSPTLMLHRLSSIAMSMLRVSTASTRRGLSVFFNKRL